MLKNKNILILVLLILLFTVNQVIEKLGIFIYPLYAYLDDLLVVPITLGSYQWVLVYLLHKRITGLQLPVILLCVLGFSFHFELLMPALSNKYTGDIVDCIMYTCGGIFYFLSSRYTTIQISHSLNRILKKSIEPIKSTFQQNA